MLTNDELVWKAFLTGDESAFSEMYKRYVRILYSYGVKMQPDAAVVEDAIQDLFVDLWRLRSRLSVTDSVKFYLFRSLRRRLHQSLRPEERLLTNADDDLSRFIGDELSIEQVLITAEQTQQQTAQLHQWLASLPARQLEALSLRYYQGFSFHQIADLLDINEQSARNLVQKALYKLRQLALLMGLTGLLFVLKNFSSIGG